VIRTIVIGVSHWHLKLYLNPLLARDDVEVVGVSDPSAEIAERVAGEVGCVASTDYRALVHDMRPDFAMVLGRHVDMAETAAFLIAEGIPFAIEKPAGLNGAEVEGIARAAERADSFAAVPFVFRQSDFVARMRERSRGERFDYLSFTMIGRPPQQYERATSGWMLDRAQSGGGALINLGVHFLDLVPHLLPGEPVEVVGAATSSAAWSLTIEDFAAVTLKVGTSIATIQTGYVYTSPREYMDMHFSVRTASAYYVARDPHTVEVYTPDGGIETWDVDTTNIGYYPRFVDDVIERLRRGDKPLAGLGEAADALRLLDRVYEISGASTPAA